MTEPQWWPKIRAVLGAWNDEPVKQAYLVRGKFEKDENYAARVKITEPLGVVEGIVEQYVATLFRTRPIVDYQSAQLEDWAKDIDGQGTTLSDFMDAQAAESVGIGVAGILVDQQPITEEQSVKFKAAGASRQAAADLGLDLSIRLLPYQAEQIVDWEFDRYGAPLWLKLASVVTERAEPLAQRRTGIEFVIYTRDAIEVHKAFPNDSLRQSIDRLTLPQILDQGAQFGSPEVTRHPNRLGRIPFVIAPGAKPRFGLQVVPPLMAAVRADVAAFNEDSHARFARWLHLSPMLNLTLGGSRKVEEVVRGDGVANVLNAEHGEKAEYASTPADAFDIAMKAVEADKLEAHRQAGSDPSGLFDQGAQPESGKAKGIRFRDTTGRKLEATATLLEAAHFDILDIASAMLTGAPFTGDVQYSRQFDLEDVDDLIARFLQIRHRILSPTWQKTITRRIAMMMAGDVSRDDMAAIAKELDAVGEAQIMDGTAVSSPTDGAMDPAGSSIGP